MNKQVQIFIRMLLISILALGAGTQFSTTAQTITMTTTKAIGGKIKLTIIAQGNVSIDGATGTFANMAPVEYTLTKQTVSITGKVTYLNCSSNQLTQLDVSKNTALNNLDCHSNQLTNLDVSKNIALKTLWCYTNQLTSLDVSKNTALKALWCYTNQFTKLDTSKNTALTELNCDSNQLTNLDASKNTALIYLNCYNNQIKGEAMTSLIESLPTVSAGKKSEVCIIDTKNAKEQNACTKADVTIAKGKGWKVYDFNGNWNDRKEYAGSDDEGQKNVITMTIAKAVGDKIGLRIKTFGDISIDGATGTFINGQYVEYTLTKQTITIMGEVTLLNCASNGLTKLDVSKNIALAELSCFSNQLTTLDVSKNAALTNLRCWLNQLTSLDVSKNAALAELSCFGNQLTTLDVSTNAALTLLSCHTNQLTKLDVSKNPSLTYLFCTTNQLTDLDLSANTALTLLSCHSNQIKDEAMTHLIKSLPMSKEGEFCVIDMKNAKEQNACTKADVTIAKGKGWKVYDFNGNWNDRKEYAGSDGNSVAAINSGSVQIYPNPAMDFVQITGAKAIAIIRLYGLDGRLVLTAKADADGAVRLDVSTLATGEYLLIAGHKCHKLVIK